MHSIVSNNGLPVENNEYHEVFEVLNNLGMADLKQTFQEHCIQDQTLNFVESEDEFKSLLKEIGIPVGRCIPIIKSWGKRHRGQEQIRMLPKVTTAEKYSQASIETANTYAQTDDFSLNDANDNKFISSATEMNLASQQELINQHTAQLPGEISVNGLPSGPLNSQPPVSYGVQQVDPFFASQMWPNIAHYPDYQGYSTFFQPPVTSVPSSMAVSDGFSSHHNAIYNHDVLDVNQGSKAIISRHESVQNTPQHQRMTSNIPKDIVDEREDLAIEQSLKDCETTELKHSYASALWQVAPAELRQDGQRRYTSNSEKLTIDTQSTKQHKRIQPTPVSHPLPRPTQSPRTVLSEKVESSNFTRCDDISVESGAMRLSSSLQTIGPKTLQGYLDALPETKEYKEAMQSRNPPKGWKPLEGRNMSTLKRASFKPMYRDAEGRMRHGVSVKGSDKSLECFKHTEGKAPASCTFAHSRLGDTLQFICVKCTYERNRTDWCSEKIKHKQYIYNLGSFKNLEGGTWKKSS